MDAPQLAADAPRARAVILGASNIARGLTTVANLAKQRLGGPLEILVAAGRGRSYGVRTNFLGRSLPGIDECGLWPALRSQREAPTRALIANVGNDLAYGYAPREICAWVERCMDRLPGRGAEAVIALLPTAKLASISEREFDFFRRLFFPAREIHREELLGSAAELEQRLGDIARERGACAATLRPEWYGFDPIHLRWSARRPAWREILERWSRVDSGDIGARSNDARDGIGWVAAARLAVQAPERRWILGAEQRGSQPALRQQDGTTLSLY